MHVGFSAVFAAPAGRPRPSVEALRERAAGRLHEVPWCRWRLDPAPLGLSEPRWIDDAQFDLAAHIVALTQPEDRGQPRELRGAALDGPVRSAGPVAAVVADLPGPPARGRADRHGGQDPPRARRRARRAADRQPDPRSRARRGVAAPGHLAATRAPRTRRAGRWTRSRGRSPTAPARCAPGRPPPRSRRRPIASVLRDARRVIGRGRRGGAVAAPPMRSTRRSARVASSSATTPGATSCRRRVEAGGTLNDVGLAAVAGAVRALLQRDGEPPPPRAAEGDGPREHAPARRHRLPATRSR